MGEMTSEERADLVASLLKMAAQNDVAWAYADIVTKAAQALQSPPAGGPGGWKWTPRDDLTREMYAAGGDAQMKLRAQSNYNHDATTEAVWRAMWDVSPSPPAPGGWRPSREQLTDIIEPVAFSLPGFERGNINNAVDAILSLRPEPSAEPDDGSLVEAWWAGVRAGNDFSATSDERALAAAKAFRAALKDTNHGR